MACAYLYKGHQFNSELELDDFILEKLPFEPSMGDMVFEMSPQQLHISKQLSDISKKSHELRKKYKEMLNTNAIYDEDGEIALEDPPYIGVNKFLSGLKNEYGKLLFPEFREDEYWIRRYAHWKVGEFNDAEIEEFGLDKDNLPKVTDSAIHESFRKQMTNKWKIQAKTGTAIHDILKICFQKHKGKYNFTLNDQTLIELINNSVDENSKEFIHNEVIKQAIDYSRQLNSQLIDKFGEGCVYYPEFMITQDTNVMNDGKLTTLMGIIDLMVIDSSGKIHIIDYKTSIHSISQFVQAKKNSYTYQLGVYRRIFEKYGFNMYEGQMLVAPIQIKDFKKDRDKYTYSGILPSELIDIGTSSSMIEKMWENIDEFMPVPFKVSITTEDAMSTVTEIMGDWFKNYQSTKKVTRESIIRRLEKNGLLKKNDNNQYVYRKYNSKDTIIATEEAEFIDKVFKYEQGILPKRLNNTIEIKKAIKESIRKGIDNVDFPSPIITQSEGSVSWLQDTLSPYCNEGWEVCDNELLESFGIIMLKTTEGYVPEQIDFVRVSTSNLTEDYRTYFTKEQKKNEFLERKGLTGRYESDVAQKSKSNSLMLEAVNGNVELMETLLLINQMTGLEGRVIGNIQVVNPYYGKGISATNEELLYCWKELNKYKSVNNDKILSGTIKFANKYDLARAKFAHIMKMGEKKDWKSDYRIFGKLRSCTSILDENINGSIDEKIQALKRLLRDLAVSDNQHKLDKVYSSQGDLKNNAVDLYNSILMAIAQLKGVNFRQQLKSHSQWIESIKIWKDGVSGTYLDNPGNMTSETLNLVSNLVTEAYQNIRDEIQKEKPKIQKLIENLKKEKQFGAISENTIGNQTSLYKNLFREYKRGGDFLFKNPNELRGAEKDLLEYALEIINKNRYPDMTDEEIQRMRGSDDPKYFRVPLAKGGEDSIASSRGLLAALRAKLSYINPKKAFELARQKVEGVFNADEDIEKQQKTELIYKMTNMFDGGENEARRIEKLEKEGESFFEHNLETLLYKHIFAYSSKNNIDGVFPMIKSAMIHICTQGSMQNTQFGEEVEYLSNYIRNKIYNQSIVDPKLQGLYKNLGLIKKAASFTTLAFAPVQAIYQPLQGLWTDISLMIRKPDGKYSFTFSHFKDALKLVYKDLAHFSDKPTICSALNELYGINDMDMNTYTEHISNAKKGIWNFANLAMKFSSRPDFYNRMTIFVSQMIGDGCLDAHSIVDNKLVYDWTKDKRFNLFATGQNKNSEEYKKQEALYYSIARQFVNEHAKVWDSNKKEFIDFKLNLSEPMPLPRAYTNKQAESMKSLGDNIYGYYSHEKKSLIMSTTLGSLWLQFKTYWSGKKNQYLQAGGVKLQGNWEHYEENGEKYYYQIDKDGNTLFNEPPLTEKQIKEKNMPLVSPFMQWKGQWQEGIILTLSSILKDIYNAGVLSTNPKNVIDAIKFGINSKWNAEDLNLRIAYRNNIKQFLFDLGIIILGGCVVGSLLGDWLEELKKEYKKNYDFVIGLVIAAANVLVLAVKNSFLDFNAFDSIGAPVQGWTPFSFEWTARTFNNLLRVATGDEDIIDGIVKCSGAGKQIKPVLDAIKPNMFKTKAEGGTWDANK